MNRVYFYAFKKLGVGVRIALQSCAFRCSTLRRPDAPVAISMSSDRKERDSYV